METLKKRINKKNFQELVQDKLEQIDCKEKKNHILKIYNNKTDKPNKKTFTEKINLNNKYKTPIKYKSIISGNSSDIFQDINDELIKINASNIYRKKVTKLFEELVDYLIFTKKNREIIDNYKNYNKFIIKRIKVKDIEDFINDKYRTAQPSTIANIKSRIRRFVRIINNEPKLDFSKKIQRPKVSKNSDMFSKMELLMLLGNLNKSNDIESMVLFYLLYFLGLNFSFVSRILLKDFKSDFKLLIIKKGKKVIKHQLTPIITQLLYNYFINSRSYNSYYFFEDNYKETKEFTRTSMIKEKFQKILQNVKYINNTKKNQIIANFSRLRKAKFITNDLNDFFIFPNSKEDEAPNKENNSVSSYQVENKNNSDIINESCLSNNISYDHNTEDFLEEELNDEKNSELHFIPVKYENLFEKHVVDGHVLNKNLFKFLKRKRNNKKKYKLNDYENKFVPFFSESSN